jgi:diguanylate cyclase (GGDEF)-like protein/PAS domain S-box-containing protein
MFFQFQQYYFLFLSVYFCLNTQLACATPLQSIIESGACDQSNIKHSEQIITMLSKTQILWTDTTIPITTVNLNTTHWKVLWKNYWEWVLIFCFFMIIILCLLILLWKSNRQLRRNSKALHETFTIYKAVLDTIPDLVWLKDVNGIYLACNPSFESFFGAKEQEIIGKTDYDFIEKKLADSFRHYDEIAMELGHVNTNEKWICLASTKQWMLLETSQVPLRGENGQLLGVLGIGHDITERKRLEEALLKSEARFRSFFEKNSSVMFLIEPSSGIIVSANQSAIHYYGYGQLEGFSISKINTLPAEKIARERERALKEERNYFNFQHQLASGEMRDVEVYSTPIETYGKTLLFSIVHDITQRKQAEIALKTERDLFSQGPVVVISWGVSEHWPIVQISSNVKDVLGFTPEEMTSNEFRYTQLIHPEDLAQVNQELNHYKANGVDRFQQSYRLRHKNSHYAWYYDFTQLQRNSQGELVGIRGYLFDQSQLKELELQLKAQQQRLFYILWGTGAGTWEWNIQTGETTFNQRWLEMLGYDRQDLAPLNINTWLNLCHPADLEKSKALLQRHFSGELEAYECEIRMKHKQGHWVWIHDRGKVISFGEDGKPLLMAGTHIDISKRKHAQEELRTLNEHFVTLLENTTDFIYFKDANSRFIFCSQTLANITHHESWRDMIGKHDLEVFPPDTAQVYYEEELPVFQQGIPLLNKVDPYYDTQGNLSWVSTNKWPVFDADKEKVIGIFGISRDVSEQHRREKRDKLRSDVLGKLAADQSLDEILTAMVYRLENENPHFYCSILLLDSEGKHLLTGAAPNLPDFYNAAVHGIPIGPRIGSCGTAAYTGERVVVKDIQHHPYWVDYREVAQRANLASCWSEPIKDMSGQVLGTFAIYHQQVKAPTEQDIILIEYAARLASIVIERCQVREKLQLAANVFTYAREGIIIADPDGLIVEVNQAFTQITGYTHEEVIGKNPRILSSGRHEPEFYASMWHYLVNKGYWSGEIWNRHKNGEVYAELLTISTIKNRDDKIQHYVALFSDITAQKKHQRQLEHIAHYDALTNLPNRILLADRLHQAITHAKHYQQHVAIIYLDLDGFKAINDNYGHQFGDQLLITVSHRMRQSLHESDTIARLGGDEFVAVLVGLEDTKDSVPILLRLLNAVSQPVYVEEQLLQVSASLGVSFYPQLEEIDADQLLRQADHAMYQAKLAGKNRYYFFDTEQDRNIRGHHESLERIAQALYSSEFILHFQPKVNMRTGEIIGAEALIRWQHPQKGLLLPEQFLPVIENHPLAVELGEWVLENALTEMEMWHEAGVKIPVSVNISAQQLQQANFIEHLQELLNKHLEAKPGCLELEILETSALGDIEQISQVMHAGLKLGVSFAIDDFGTGYSSLTYLKHLPAAQLKIDRSFVRDMLDDPDDLAILQGVLGLATAFRRSVIAEGVESKAHGELLLQLGCELAQGYDIARPMSSKDLLDWANHWQPYSTWLNQLQVSHDDLPMLFASVEHRGWVQSLEDYLQGNQASPPPLNYELCRFGKWLEQEGEMRYGTQVTFQQLKKTHREIHNLAQSLLKLKEQQQNSVVIRHLPKLRQMRDKLLYQLKQCLHL